MVVRAETISEPKPHGKRRGAFIFPRASAVNFQAQGQSFPTTDQKIEISGGLFVDRFLL